MGDTGSLDGLKVLVVEDEALVLIGVEDMLVDFGCEIVGPAMRLEVAQELVATGAACDIALLDVNLAGELVLPVAEALKARNVPVVFASGYGQSGVLQGWTDCPVLQKPYTEAELEAALRRALQLSRTRA